MKISKSKNTLIYSSLLVFCKLSQDPLVCRLHLLRLLIMLLRMFHTLFMKPLFLLLVFRIIFPSFLTYPLIAHLLKQELLNLVTFRMPMLPNFKVLFVTLTGIMFPTAIVPKNLITILALRSCYYIICTSLL